MTIFTAAPNGDQWIIAWTGYDDKTGQNWNVTTNSIHGSDLHLYSGGAKYDAELIAKLLNWYYGSIDGRAILDKFIGEE